ncbi:hypothetical protein ACHAWT_008738 [Skeletonema menzelii]|mmetsp:Transcript_9589/g.15895  ORF Transcript_9589/g.15895 Transcript_9589/m.15895 type:complete len:147 (-) Transcript_9589:372-812(-)
MFDTPKTTKNDGDQSEECPPPPRPNANLANLPSSVGLPLSSSSSDHQRLQRRPAPLLSLSRRQTSSSMVTFSSLASDRPSLSLTSDDDSSLSSSRSSEQDFFLAAPAARRPIVHYDPVLLRNNNIVDVVPQGYYPVIRLQPRRSSP